MDNKDWWSEQPQQENDFYKMKVGDNKLRLLTQLVRVNQCFEGKFPNTKYKGMVDDNYKAAENESVSTQGWCWGIDRATGDLKIIQLGTGILQHLTNLRSNPEYAFDDFPMPYDITIHNTGVGPTRYSVTAARQNTEITEKEQAELDKKTTVESVIKAIRAKRNPPEEIEHPADLIPF